MKKIKLITFVCAKDAINIAFSRMRRRENEYLLSLEGSRRAEPKPYREEIPLDRGNQVVYLN